MDKTLVSVTDGHIQTLNSVHWASWLAKVAFQVLHSFLHCSSLSLRARPVSSLLHHTSSLPGTKADRTGPHSPPSAVLFGKPSPGHILAPPLGPFYSACFLCFTSLPLPIKWCVLVIHWRVFVLQEADELIPCVFRIVSFKPPTVFGPLQRTCVTKT